MLSHYETTLDNGLWSFLSSTYAGFIKFFISHLIIIPKAKTIVKEQAHFVLMTESFITSARVWIMYILSHLSLNHMTTLRVILLLQKLMLFYSAVTCTIHIAFTLAVSDDE